MAASHPPPYIHYPAPPNAHQTTLILLHGTSQTGPELASTLLSFQIKNQPLTSLLPNTKFLFPTGAPKQTTVFNGKETHAWFDIHSFSDRTIGESSQIPGLRESVVYLTGLMKREVEELLKNGVGSREAGKRVVVLGFSLGCAVGVVGGLCGEFERMLGGAFGGFVGMSGWLPFRKQIEGVIEGAVEEGGDERSRRLAVVRYLRGLLELDKVEEENEAEDSKGRVQTPVLLCHGEKDVKAKYQWGVEMRDVLMSTDMDVDFKSYPDLEHWFNEDEMRDIVRFLKIRWAGLET